MKGPFEVDLWGTGSESLTLQQQLLRLQVAHPDWNVQQHALALVEVHGPDLDNWAILFGYNLLVILGEWMAENKPAADMLHEERLRAERLAKELQDVEKG